MPHTQTSNLLTNTLDDGGVWHCTLEKRPEGGRLTQDARDGKFDVIVFYKLELLGFMLWILDAVSFIIVC